MCPWVICDYGLDCGGERNVAINNNANTRSTSLQQTSTPTSTKTSHSLLEIDLFPCVIYRDNARRTHRPRRHLPWYLTQNTVTTSKNTNQSRKILHSGVTSFLPYWTSKACRCRPGLLQSWPGCKRCALKIRIAKMDGRTCSRRRKQAEIHGKKSGVVAKVV